MTRTLAIFVSGATALGALALPSAADAQIRYYGPPAYNSYGPPAYNYYGPRRFYESPMYAPDAPAHRRYDNPGIPDFQNGSRG